MAVPVIPSDLAFVSAGAQKIPVLQGITSLTGATNSLQSVSTGQLRTPYMVCLKIAGVAPFWTARAGTDATDVPNGIVRAGDWAQTGVVWYSSNFP